MYRKKVNEKDVRYILEHLRSEDKKEAICVKGENYIEECLKDIMQYDDVILGCKKSDDTPVCIGGCVPQTNGIGVVWLLSTDEIVNHQICLLRNIKKEMEKYNKKYWLTYNFLYYTNILAKKWLKKFGYKFDIQKFEEGYKIPEGFEFFYKRRRTRGLGQ